MLVGCRSPRFIRWKPPRRSDRARYINRYDDDYSDEDDDSDDHDEYNDDADDRDELKHNQYLRLAQNDETLDRFCRNAPGKWSDADFRLLGRSLSKNTHLKHLTMALNNCECRKRNSSQAMNTFCQGITECNIQTLDLVCHCGQTQARLFEGGIARSSTLQRLTLHDVTVNPLAVSKVLETTPPTASPRQHHVCRLTHLCLTQCSIDNMDILTLSLALTDNRSLLSLGLAENYISTIGVIYFCQNWKDDSPLQELDLNSNEIAFGGALILLEATKRHVAFTNLNLNYNTDIGFDGLRLIGEQLPHISLSNLDVGSCTPSERGISEETRRAACRALADGLRQNTSLISLHVEANHFNEMGNFRIMQAATFHPTLESLTLGDCSSSIQQIAAELPKTKLKHLDLSINDKHSSQEGQALLQGIQNNRTLVEFAVRELRNQWQDPIMFHVDLNKTCWPLLLSNKMSSGIWPHVLAYFDRRYKRSHVFFVLLQQPWLLNQVGESSSWDPVTTGDSGDKQVSRRRKRKRVMSIGNISFS